MRFKRQTRRSTRMDETENINIFLKGFEFSIIEGNYWGSFGNTKEDREIKENHKEHTAENPLIEIQFNNKRTYQFTLEELKEKLKKILK